MNETISLQLTEIVGAPLCVASADGQKVYDQLAMAFKDDRRVNLSFLNVESLTSAFLNAAVGQLYGTFPEEQIKRCLSVSNIDPDDLALLKRVIETAKLYFKSPAQIESARMAILGGEDEG
jgi:hypothetical protein